MRERPVGRRAAGLAVVVAALWSATARAEARVDAQGCPGLDGARLRQQIDLELSVTAGAPRPGELDLSVACTPSTVHIAMPRERVSRDLPFPDAADSDKERTIAIAAAQTVATAPPPAVRPAGPMPPGLGLQLALTFIGYGASARGWWPVTDRAALVVAPAFEWTYGGAGGARVARYQLELAFAYRPPPLAGMPQNEVHLLVVPAYNSARGFAPTDPLPPAWNVTLGFGFGPWLHAGRLLIGLFTDYGWSLPRNQWPTRESYVLSHLWLRTSVVFAFEPRARRGAGP